MLLIDRVVEFHHGKSLVALKNVSYNESYFQGHFPNRPVMPAVIILEAMAQATGILVLRSMDKLPSEKSIYYFVGIDGARFRRPVVPGDQLRIEVNVLRSSRGIWKLRSEATVAGDVVASGDLMGAMREIDA
jgi:3-hydroxyacyl-[acyl-carrier-protein] dehydratase